MSTHLIRLAITALRLTVSIFVLFFSFSYSSLFAGDAATTSIHVRALETPLSVSEFMEGDERLNMFTAAFKSLDSWREFNAKSQVTMFVVPDAALRSEGSAFLLEVVLLKPENTTRLNELMAFHLVPNEIVSVDDLRQRNSLRSENGECISIGAMGDSTKIGPEAFITETITASNGYIHFIDRLLWQPYQGSRPCAGGSG